MPTLISTMPTDKWVVESLEKGAWDPAGTILAADPSSAVLIASRSWPDVQGRRLRAILWEQASEDRRKIAVYEDGVRLQTSDILASPGVFERGGFGRQSVRSYSSATTASDARDRRIRRRGFGVAAAVVAGLAILFTVARPSLATFVMCLVIAAAGAWSSFRRARLSLLDSPDGNESSAGFGAPAVILGGSVLFALLDRAWLAAIADVLFYFLGGMAGIVIHELTARR